MSEQNNKVSYSAQSSNKYFGILLNLKGGVIPFDSIKYRAPPDDVCCDKCIIDIELLCIIRLETVTLIIINWMLRHQTSPESPGHTTCTVLTMESATLTWENYYCSFDFDSPLFGRLDLKSIGTWTWIKYCVFNAKKFPKNNIKINIVKKNNNVRYYR